MLHNRTTITDALRALSEPRRLEIMELVRGGELTSGAIASHFDVTPPAISQHLKVLADAGLVIVRHEGTKRLYRAAPEGLSELQAYLTGFWRSGLDRMAEEAEKEERRRKDASAN